jgi:hypothetical protein
MINNDSSENKIQATLYVSVEGCDSNSGTENAPFKTVLRAQQAVREINQNMHGNIVVQIAGGRYFLNEPLLFKPQDSGTNGFEVIYAAAPGQQAILDGGERITGWTKSEYDSWVVKVDFDAMRHLYVNKKRALRSMMFGQLLGHLELLENGNGYRTASDIASWLVGAPDIEFIYRWTWTHTRLPVREVRKVGINYEIIMKQPEFFLARTKQGTQILDPLFMENFPPFPPAMQLPGIWYFDSVKKLLYYKPEVGEDVNESEIIAPRLEKLLEIRGTLDKPVTNLRFYNIGFEHATWLEPNRTGMVDIQATFRQTSDSKLTVPKNVAPENPVFLKVLNCECVKTPANIVCHSGKNIKFTGCRFARLGSVGLDIEYGSSNVSVTDCEFTDISGAGIQVADVQRDDHHPTDPRTGVRDIEVNGCEIHHTGKEFRGSVGLFVGYARNVTIINNEMHHLPYSAISLGWGWGELDVVVDAASGAIGDSVFTCPAHSGGHLVENNHIHDTVMEMDDGAAIYNLGKMPGTIIRNNVIHDSRGWSGGIYLDNGCSDITITQNRIYDVLTPIIHAEGCEKVCSMTENIYSIDAECAKKSQ